MQLGESLCSLDDANADYTTRYALKKSRLFLLIQVFREESMNYGDTAVVEASR